MFLFCPWDHYKSQEKMETMSMQNLGGQTKSIMVFLKVAYWDVNNNYSYYTKLVVKEIQWLSLCSNLRLVKEIAWFLGVFGINTTSDISKFTKIQYHEPLQRRVIFGEFWNITSGLLIYPKYPKKPCCFQFIIQGKEILHLRNRRNFYI